MAMLKYANQREHCADIALDSLSSGSVSRRRFWLLPALLGPAPADLLGELQPNQNFRLSFSSLIVDRSVPKLRLRAPVKQIA